MKKALKLTLVVVCTMISTSLFAQKFGRINSQEIVTSMNEFKEAQTQIQAYAKDLDAQLETIGVEFNTKLQEFQQSADTLGDAMRQSSTTSRPVIRSSSRWQAATCRRSRWSFCSPYSRSVSMPSRR